MKIEIKKYKDELSDILADISFIPEVALGQGLLKVNSLSTRGLTEIFKKHKDFELLYACGKTRVYTFADSFRDLMIMSKLYLPRCKEGQGVFIRNLVINVGSNRELCFSELENYAEKTGIKLKKIDFELNSLAFEHFDFRCNERRNQIFLALRGYILLKEYGELFNIVYKKTLEDMIVN